MLNLSHNFCHCPDKKLSLAMERESENGKAQNLNIKPLNSQTTKMRRSFELSELCLDAGYILALDAENADGQSVFKAVLWWFLFSKQISAIYSAIP